MRTRERSEQRTGSRRPRGQQSGPGDDGGSGGGPAAREAAAPGEAGRQPPSSAMLRSRPRGRRGLPQPQTADESRAVLTRKEIRRHGARPAAEQPCTHRNRPLQAGTDRYGPVQPSITQPQPIPTQPNPEEWVPNVTPKGPQRDPKRTPK